MSRQRIADFCPGVGNLTLFLNDKRLRITSLTLGVEKRMFFFYQYFDSYTKGYNFAIRYDNQKS